jgi:glycosyltransferase involved in cell wall biosynthesis
MRLEERIAILHYAGPPGVGGVESMMAHQARGLADLGYQARVISGKGGDFDARVETQVDPSFGSTHVDVLQVKRELDAGIVSPAFEPLVQHLVGALRRALDGCAVCIAHNVLSLNKNLALTAALARLHGEGGFRLLAWCSDLAWTNPQYLPELHDGYPWNLLCQPWPRAHYVTISEPRRAELAQLLGLPEEQIAVVTPGIDPAAFFRWTPTTRRLVEQLRLLDADGLLLLPARLTRRKNIGLALRVLGALRRQSGSDFRLLVTGPPGPHNPANPGYLGELLALRGDLRLADAAHFLYAFGEAPDSPLIPDDDTIADLYRLADALFFPSLQEGFGIPVLEAGLNGLPIFCADIPPLRSTAGDDAVYFDPQNGDPEAIASAVQAALSASPAYRLRARVRQTYRWDTIIQKQVVPLLEDA